MRPTDSENSPLLEGMLPAQLSVAEGPLTATVEDLLPEERALVARAVVGRQAEFATGRVLARGLLEALGGARAPLLRDEDRVPLWPDGVVGSIAHTTGRCLVAVGASREVRGVGVDIEPDEPVQAGIERRVCVPRELEALSRIADPDLRGRRCRLIFSAKESVYKAFFPRVREFWGFHEVELEGDFEAGFFEAKLPASAGRPRIQGRCAGRDGYIVTAVVDAA